MARHDRGLLTAFSSPLRLRSSALVALTLGALAAASHAQAPCAPAIEFGMNPSFQTWYSRAIVFADAAQRVRGYSFWNNGPAGAAPLIASGSGLLGEGWPDPAALAPGARYGAHLFVAMEGTLPDGRQSPYVVTWAGAGRADLAGANVIGESNRSAQRVEVFVDPSLGQGNAPLALTFTATDPADPVRDVHVWLPGMERASRIFWPPFVEKVRTLNAGRGPHTWRTLDWTRVNEYGRPLDHGGFVFRTQDAITPASPSQGTARGVAVEYQVALCNLLGMNLHFQLPHRTDDLSERDYVRYLYRELRVIRDGSQGIPGLFGGRAFAGLDPALTVTVELSNEIWNSAFPVNAWMNAEATRKGISFSEEIASQIQTLFTVADLVFDGPDAPRLRKYVAGFAADPGYLKRILAQLQPGTRVDAVGPAAYLAPRRADIDAWLVGAVPGSCPNCPSEDDLLATAGAAVDVLRGFLAQHRLIAQSYTNPDGSHPALELYEGGQNFKSSGRPWAPAAKSVQTRPELFDLFADRYVPMLVEEGVSLVNWYSFMTDQDAPNVDSYGFFNDMEETVTLPVTRPYQHEGAPKAAVVLLGPPLAASCPRALASFRTAPGNVSSYSATPPVLGGVFTATVDLTTTGNDAAFVVASLLSTSVPLPSGQTVLSSFDNAEFLLTRNGPIATWRVLVPNDPSLAGVQIATQAFHVGGGPVRLSNAMDLTFGR